MSNDKERLLDPPEVYIRLRELTSVTQKTQGELAQDYGMTKAYLQKILSGKVAISGSAIKAFIKADLDVIYIFTGKSDRERIRKLEEKIETVKELMREGFFASDDKT
jgi:transcriptional regulator with XRE-family HTH domain